MTSTTNQPPPDRPPPDHPPPDHTPGHPPESGPSAGAIPPSLSSRVASGAGWMVGARFLVRIMGFVNTIIVARLLVPDDFGLVAIGVTTMQLLQGLSELGVNQAIVRFRDATDDDVNTLFTFSAVRGVVLALILCAIAPVAAAFYDDPRVVGVFLGVMIYPLSLGFINPRFYEFERDLDFSREFYVVVLNKMAGVIVSIAVALIFRTYWAIILGLVTNGLVQLVLSYVMRPYRPRLTLASARKFLDFMGWLTACAFVNALNNKLPTLILARILGPAGAGNFFVGQQLAEMPITELAAPMTRAVYPGLSSLQGSDERMRRAYLKGVEALGALALPVGLGFALVAHDLIFLLLGEKWMGTIPVIEILSPVIGIHMIFAPTFYYALARGLTRLLFFRELIFLVLRLPVFIWATLSYGLIGAVSAFGVLGFVHMGLNMALYGRMTGRSWFEPLWTVRRSAVSALAMVAVFFALQAALPHGLDPAGIALLAGKIALAAITYGAMHLGLWRLAGSPGGIEAMLIDYGTRFGARLRRKRAA